MASPLSADLFTDIEDAAVDMVISILQGVVSEMLVDGRAPGDVELNRQQRILAFQNNASTGVMDTLATVNPKLARDDTQQYMNDLGKTPAFTGQV